VSYSVLVVDDYEPWRRFVCREIERSARWRVIAETGDGLSAVRHAHALAPDLVLLDIGLPALNGFEAAREIFVQSPNSKILFVTGQRSPDLAQAALRLGAGGYLVKTEAAGKLLFAMETVIHGGWFMSAGLGQFITERAVPFASHSHQHEAAFSFDEGTLLEEYARFAETAIQAGESFVFAGATSRRAKLEERLRGRGIDLSAAASGARYISVDVAETLSHVVIGDWPDEGHFDAAANALLARARSDRPVALCGECAPELWKQGNAEAALRLEHLWDALARSRDVRILCGYLIETPFLGEEGYAFFQRVCAEHSTVHLR
jgi:DNA-binding NarL/FixJ family response regulator